MMLARAAVLASLVCLVAVATAAPVRAQQPSAGETPSVVAVLSVGGDAPESFARLARAAVAAALVDEGVRVLPEGDLALRVPPSRLRGCDSARCAWDLAREVGASSVAAVATWRGEGGEVSSVTMSSVTVSSVTVSLVSGPERAHAATEDVRDGDVGAGAVRALRAAQAAQVRALLVEGAGPSVSAAEGGGGEAALRGSEGEADEQVEGAPRARSLEEYVLPTILGVVGLALTAASVYALMPEQCALSGPSGVCLRGEGPNVGLGVVFAVTGGLSIAGAIAWLIVGGSAPSMGSIDVVLGPEGGQLGWRGRL
jgi:hypothetical protein